jgi:hypothetical protein
VHRYCRNDEDSIPVRTEDFPYLGSYNVLILYVIGKFSFPLTYIFNKLDVNLLVMRKAGLIRSNRLGANKSAFPQEDNVFRFNLLGVDDFVSLNM